MLDRRFLLHQVNQCGNPVLLIVLVLLLTGCSVFRSQPVPPPDPAITIVVAPVTMEATISKSTHIHSFETTPPPEEEPIVKKQLIEEVQLKAQQLLTAHFAKQPGFTLIPFEEARRVESELDLSGKVLDEKQLLLLAYQAKADIVISTRITAYGSVPWKYWATGLATETLAEVIAVGFATGWNPAAVGGYFAVDFLLIDLPLWTGGAYIAGWAFRPVIIEVDAIQLGSCSGTIWSKQEEAIRVPGSRLDEYTPEERGRKEIQLQINLDRAMEEIAETASQKLRLQPCTEAGQPVKIRGWAFLPF